MLKRVKHNIAAARALWMVVCHNPQHIFEKTLGLHLAPVKLPAETLVIDHIEKPSGN
jgi:hypothetical protein